MKIQLFQLPGYNDKIYACNHGETDISLSSQLGAVSIFIIIIHIYILSVQTIQYSRLPILDLMQITDGISETSSTLPKKKMMLTNYYYLNYLAWFTVDTFNFSCAL